MIVSFIQYADNDHGNSFLSTTMEAKDPQNQTNYFLTNGWNTPLKNPNYYSDLSKEISNNVNEQKAPKKNRHERNKSASEIERNADTNLTCSMVGSFLLLLLLLLLIIL